MPISLSPETQTLIEQRMKETGVETADELVRVARECSRRTFTLSSSPLVIFTLSPLPIHRHTRPVIRSERQRRQSGFIVKRARRVVGPGVSHGYGLDDRVSVDDDGVTIDLR